MELRPGGRTTTFLFSSSSWRKSVPGEGCHLPARIFILQQIDRRLDCPEEMGGGVDDGTFKAEELMTVEGHSGLSVLCTSLRDAASPCMSFKFRAGRVSRELRPSRR